MKAVLLSIRPKWCELIARCEKTIEVRKTRPKLKTPFTCYIYCTCSNISVKERDRNIFTDRCGKVIGEFVCNAIDSIHVFENGSIKDWQRRRLYESRLSYAEMSAYIGCGKSGYGWHISDLKIYDKPKLLYDFRAKGRCKGGIKCEKCPFCQKDEDFVDTCFFDGGIWYKPILKAPQSWCYVEECL